MNKQPLIKIGSEPFQWKWLKRRGFYRILWFWVVSNFGWYTINENPFDGNYVSFGTHNPNQDLIAQGFQATPAGHFLNCPIIYYSKDEN